MRSPRIALDVITQLRRPTDPEEQTPSLWVDGRGVDEAGVDKLLWIDAGKQAAKGAFDAGTSSRHDRNQIGGRGIDPEGA